jgi:hypothetical protein
MTSKSGGPNHLFHGHEKKNRWVEPPVTGGDNRWITGGEPPVKSARRHSDAQTQQIAGAYVFIRGGAVSAQVNHTAPTMPAL